MLRLESILMNIIGMSIENALSLFDIMKKITQGKARQLSKKGDYPPHTVYVGLSL